MKNNKSLFSAGYAWAHNNVSYFQHYHEGKEIGYWFILTAILGGCVGVFAGGYISDLVVTRLGVHSRLWLLGACTLLATPFSVLTLPLAPPYAFATLIFYYFFGEQISTLNIHPPIPLTIISKSEKYFSPM